MKIINEFCEGHEVLIVPHTDGNLVLVTIPKSFNIDDFMNLIDKYEIPDNPNYGVRFGDKEEVRVIR
tara:strand:+ start:606 stop:806 length:201 start_codon:yes stop_codon:yes gene_type:complete